ncbi:hypothetical protein [Streptacidiphilus cavernicola]|uniref:Uncharacterized protein n=1 Tax=Streptacidiphilus cavernicola TaxID=3342716 RepID=A0ABV6VNS7_9ACTN
MIDLSKRQRAWLVFPDPFEQPERTQVIPAPEDADEFDEACSYLMCTELFVFIIDAPSAAAALGLARVRALAGRAEWGW